MSLPRLRVRSEFSFRKAYGKVERVAEVLDDINVRAAALVDDSGTWGHVRWEKACGDKGIAPGFGTEFTIPDENGLKPRCWALAEDTRAFYRFASGGPESQEDFMDAPQGVVRFAGTALTHPDAFDYIDINQSSITVAQRALELAKKTKKPIALVPVNDYPAPSDESGYLAWVDDKKPTSQHLLGEAELRQAFHFLTDAQFRNAVMATYEIAERTTGLALPRAPVIQVPGSLKRLVNAGKKRRLSLGHIAEWDDAYETRLRRELDMIAQKDFASYFIVVAELVNWAKQHMLVGPARGSSAGSLVCYLLGITEVDPLPYGLLFERFIDINRNDLPDIDIDFNDKKRPMVFEHLAEKYGHDNVARIGSINTLKPRSVIAHASKKLGIPHGAGFAVLNVLIEYSSGDSRYGKGLEDTLQNTQPGRDFMERYPEAAIMSGLENHASHTGVHAAGVIVCNSPVVEYCTVTQEGVAQLDKIDAEALGLLKIDALGLRTLGVIEDTGCITNEELYDLKFDDPVVFQIFNDAKFSGVFQFEGGAQRRVSIQVPIDSFTQIDHVTALARPGPLGGGASNHYINRNAGREETTYRHPSMEEYLSETMGVVLYQEQVMRIVREIGQFSWENTSIIRKAMSGRKGVEFFDQQGVEFIKGAAGRGIPPDEAKTIWDEICSFGAWGMNKSHTHSYAVISYWCAYMKAYHPLEYAASCLRNAKDDEQVIEILRELISEGVNYVPFDPDLSEADWVARDGKLLGGYQNLVGIGPVKSTKYIEKRNAIGLDEKDRAALAKRETKFSDLTPAHTLWQDIYDNPVDYNIRGVVRQFADLEDGENAVVVAKMIRRERRDENEAVRLARRNGVAKTGETLFLDMFVVDDSVSKPVVARINPRLWRKFGIAIADRAVDNQDWFLVRGRWLAQFSMLSAENIRCLTNRELFIQ